MSVLQDKGWNPTVPEGFTGINDGSSEHPTNVPIISGVMPQADGDSRPFGQPDADGRYLLSLEKRGPAFGKVETFDMESRPGLHISEAASQLIALAKANGRSTKLLFNDTPMTAYPDSSVEDVLDAYEVVREQMRPKAPEVTREMLIQSLQSQAIQCVGEVLNALGRRCFLDVIPTWTRLLALAGVSLPLHRVSPRQRWEWTEMTEAVTKALRYASQVDTKAGLIQWGEADALLRGYAMDLAVQDEAVAIDDADPRHATFLNNLAVYKAFAEGRDSWATR